MPMSVFIDRKSNSTFQYKISTRRQQYGVSVCQYIPADPIDNYVVAAFFEAVSSIELDLYQKAMQAKKMLTAKS